MQCSFIKKNGQQCEAKAIKNDEFCFWHSEKSKKRSKEAAQKGGDSPKRHYGREEEIEIKNVENILVLIEQTINDIRQNRTNARISYTIGYLAGIALKVIEKNDLEKRMEVIEHALKLKKETN